ncbi:hypothetical protein Tco_0648334 [Tanacetum coccineum]
MRLSPKRWRVVDLLGDVQEFDDTFSLIGFRRPEYDVLVLVFSYIVDVYALHNKKGIVNVMSDNNELFSIAYILDTYLRCVSKVFDVAAVYFRRTETPLRQQFRSLLMIDASSVRDLDQPAELRLDIKGWVSKRFSTYVIPRWPICSLEEWDLNVEAGRVTDFDINKREEWLMDLQTLDQLERADIKQKSRVRWAVEGDENSRFKQRAEARPGFRSPLFHKLSTSDASFLESDISMDEVM